MENLLGMSIGRCEISFHSSSRQHLKIKIGVQDFGGTFSKYFFGVPKNENMKTSTLSQSSLESVGEEIGHKLIYCWVMLDNHVDRCHSNGIECDKNVIFA
jgi:hypothetical protein